jgi:hypothetical protein
MRMSKIKRVGRRVLALFSEEEAGEIMNENRISFIDVKALYDAAFEEKDRARACLKTFRALMGEAERLEAVYRAQIKADQMRFYGRAA